MPRTIALVLSAVALAGCWTAAPHATTPPPTAPEVEPAPEPESGRAGGVALGVGIGVGLTVAALVVGGIVLGSALDDIEPIGAGWEEAYCGSGCH